MGEEMQVVLARLEGKVESLTQVVEIRLRAQERDCEQWRTGGEREHTQMKRNVEQTAQSVRELQEFKSKTIGIGIGLSLASGTVSGLMVLLVSGGL